MKNRTTSDVRPDPSIKNTDRKSNYEFSNINSCY